MGTRTPAYSAGARYERKAFRAYLERKLTSSASPVYERMLDWVRQRQSRYEKKPGGL